MMIQPTKEEIELYNRLKSTTDPKEIAKIRKKLKEISVEQQKEFSNCPFVH